MSLRIGGFATLLQVFDMPTSLAFYRDVHVTIIRRDSAMLVTPSSAPPFAGPLRAPFISADGASDRFRRELAFI